MFRRLATSSCGAASSSAALVAGCSSSSSVAVNVNSNSARGIRTQIPPRPLVTVVTYLDRGGNPIRNRVETELAIVKTRDNLFWLQRVMPDGSHIRWRVPGLDKMKNAASFETFSMHDVDEGGGVRIPMEVFPWAQNTPPEYADGILTINQVSSLGKVTRKDRRYYNRELFAHRTEHNDKYSLYWSSRIFIAFTLGWYVMQRAVAAYSNGRSFFDPDPWRPQGRIDETGSHFYRYLRFGDDHPEHATHDHKQFMASPGQVQLAFARSDLHGEDVHTPDIDSMFAWQCSHFYSYRHWPRPLDQ